MGFFVDRVFVVFLYSVKFSTYQKWVWLVSFLLLGGSDVVSDQGSSNSEVLFLHLVSMFQVAAMQQLGKLIDPVSNEIKRDLVQAKATIDVLDMLKKKTAGNLTEPEQEFLEKMLFELHMNYVDEVKEADKTEGNETASEDAVGDSVDETEAPPVDESAEEGDQK